MAQFTITIPDAAVTMLQQRRTTRNAYLVSIGIAPMPPLSQAVLTSILKRWIKSQIEQESLRLDPGDGSVILADEALTAGW